MTKLYPTIGLEIHVELKTKSKMFCGCPAEHFQVKPNTHTCPVCLGLPGALPVPNQKAVDWTILTGLALNCRINQESTFDRKHYFYPDLPKGFQISQFDDPFCQQGFIQLDSGKKILINRVHLEEDTAKLIHKKIKDKDVTLVDFNRSGVALMEIVTEPDVASGNEAKEFLKKLRDILRRLQVSDCDMEKGSMRLEANISLTSDPKHLADYKIEVKNLNSFRFVDQAINFEIERQTVLLKQGITPVQETRGYDDLKKQTFSQRIKEAAGDYRYFPEPDIPPIALTKEYVENLRKLLPKLPEAEINELIQHFHLNISTAQLLVKDAVKLAYFNKYVNKIEPQTLANLIINKKIDLDKPPRLKTTTQTLNPKIIAQVLKENADVVAKYKAGKTSVIGFLVGQVMKQTHGKVDPRQAKDLLLQAVKVLNLRGRTSQGYSSKSKWISLILKISVSSTSSTNCR